MIGLLVLFIVVAAVVATGLLWVACALGKRADAAEARDYQERMGNGWRQ
jgi:hypothetical protein